MVASDKGGAALEDDRRPMGIRIQIVHRNYLVIEQRCVSQGLATVESSKLERSFHFTGETRHLLLPNYLRLVNIMTCCYTFDCTR